MQNKAHKQSGIEELRHILACQQQKAVDYADAQEVGASLIEFFTLLAKEPENEPAA